MARTLSVLLVVVSLAGLCLAQEPTTKPAVKATVAAKPVAKPVIIKPYNPIVERGKFFKAAGKDSELDQKEFAANKGKKDSFVRNEDSWPAMLGFDKNNNKSLDWFEADAYRRAKRKSGVIGPGRRGRTGMRGGQEGRRIWGGMSEEDTKKYDKDGDGRLSREERKAAFRARGEERRKQMLEKYDTNEDGKLDGEERKAMYDAFRKTAAERMDRWLRQRHDKDGDGELNAQEQAAYDKASKDRQERMERYRAASEKRRKEYMDKWGKDGDGEISGEERTAIRESYRAERDKRRKEFMDKWDKDGDGEISATEREAARAAGDRSGGWRVKFGGGGHGRRGGRGRRGPRGGGRPASGDGGQ